MELSSTPYVLTVSCELRKSVPAIDEPCNAGNFSEDLAKPGGTPLQIETAFADTSETKKDLTSNDQGSASAQPLRLSSGGENLVFETSVTIRSPTKPNHASKAWQGNAVVKSRIFAASDPVGEEARKALRRHRRRLAKIVVDHWVYVARHRILATRLLKLHNYQMLRTCLKAWRYFTATKQIERNAKEVRVQAMRRRIFKEWVAFLHQQYERKGMEVDVVRKLCQNKLRAAWTTWTAFKKRNVRKFLEDSELEEGSNEDEDAKDEMLAAAFAVWRAGRLGENFLSASHNHLERNISERSSWSSSSLDSTTSSVQVPSVLSTAFQYWTQFKAHSRKAKDMQKLADNHYSSCNKRKVLSGLRSFRGREKVKLAHIKLAEDHWKFRELRRRLRLWHGACGPLYARRILKKQAATKRINWLLGAAFEAWSNHTSAKSRTRARSAALSKKFKRLNMKRAWESWMNVRDVLKLDRMNDELALRLFETSRLSTSFRAWTEFFKLRKKKAKQNEKAEALRRKTLARLALGSWKQFRLLAMQHRLAELDAMLYRQGVLGRKVFRAWEEWRASRQQKEIQRKDALAMYSQLVQRWACERILAHGLRLQSVRLNHTLELQAARFVASLKQAAPFARKWKSLVKRTGPGTGARAERLGSPINARDLRKSNREVEPTLHTSPWPASLMALRPLDRPAARRPRVFV